MKDIPIFHFIIFSQTANKNRVLVSGNYAELEHGFT